MAISAPADTYFAYNDFTFPVNVKTKVLKDPVESGDNRKVKCSKITISATGFITQTEADAYAAANGLPAGSSLDDVMVYIRRKLSVNGKNLRYVYRGYGQDLNINGNEIPATAGADAIPAIRDVAYGPKPGKFAWWALGGGNGVYGAGFEWSIDTWIAECGQFTIQSGVFLEISFTVAYETGEDQLVTITHAGTAQIPMSLLPDGTIERTIDDELERIILPAPVGFMRRMSRQISADRANCSFTITDRQVEVPYPDDCTAADIRYRLKQERPFMPLWQCSISATLRLRPAANRMLAWSRFFNIASQRIAHARNSATVGGERFRDQRPGVLPGVLEIDEDLLANSCRLSLGFRIIGAPLNKILGISGLWRPLINAANPPMAEPWDAVSWNNSLIGATNASTWGTLVARFDRDADVIIDVCDGALPEGGHVGRSPGVSLSPAAVTENAESGEPDLLDAVEPSLFVLGDNQEAVETRFPPETSWIAWDCSVTRIADHHQVRHKPLKGTVQTKPPAIDPFGTVEQLASDTQAPESSYDSDTPDIVQQISSPSEAVRIVGYGLRVAYRVNPPKLITYGGRTATLQTERVTETTKGTGGDVLLFRTNWDLVYLIDGPPSGMPIMADPMLGTDGFSGQ